MLVLDIYQNAAGDVTVQYNPQQWESIGQLKSILSNYNIENPLVTFSQRHKGEYYNNVSEEYVQADAFAKGLGARIIVDNHMCVPFSVGFCGQGNVMVFCGGFQRMISPRFPKFPLRTRKSLKKVLYHGLLCPFAK